MSLSKRIFSAFIAFVIVPLFVLGSVSYLVFQHINQEKYAEQTEMTLKSISRNIHSMISTANAFSDFWVTTKDSVESLQESFNPNAYPSDDSETASDYEILRERELLRRRVLLTSPDLKSVTLYRNDEQIIKVNYYPDTTVPLDRLTAHPIYPEVLRKNGAPVWIGPYEDELLTGENNLFTQIRVLLDVDTLASKGILVIRYQLRELDRIFDFFSRESKLDRRYLIVGSHNTIVFDTQKQLEGKRFTDLTDTTTERGIRLSGTDYQSKTIAFEGRKSLVSVMNMQELERLGVNGDWKLVSVTPWQYLSGDMAVVLRWMIAIMLVSLACAVAFNMLFVRRTVSFIVSVVKAMRRVERGDLTTRVEVVGNDETTSLSKGFNSLIRRVSELLDDVKQEQHRKRRAEMMLLQAQIKPHFLFNTLESINILAVQNEGRKVSKMVQQLARLLRISIQPKEEISIGEELEHLRHYLDIQKYRFEDVFEFAIDVPEELLAQRILKLTLQPLVENSIQHGFEGIGYLGRIEVTAKVEHGDIAFYVGDNGIGIAGERMAELAARGETSLQDMYAESPETGERRGLGFGNVADRLRIHYGSPYGLMLCSSRGYGTKIRIVIPMTEGRSRDETDSAARG